MTVHRTWIRPDGTKAPVDQPRSYWFGLPKPAVSCGCGPTMR